MQNVAQSSLTLKVIFG